MEWKEVATSKIIKKEIDLLSERISRDYKDKIPICAVCVLKGAVPFFSDLIRSISIDIETEFIFASSYYNSETPMGVQLDMSRIGDIENKHVLVVDDIYDTGSTLESIKTELSYLKPASIKTCTFLLKSNSARITTPDYYCIEVENDLFYVGYGLDYKGLGRNFPFIVSKAKDGSVIDIPKI